MAFNKGSIFLHPKIDESSSNKKPQAIAPTKMLKSVSKMPNVTPAY